jgi:hypothetical protein
MTFPQNQKLPFNGLDKSLNNCKQYIIYMVLVDGLLHFGIAVDPETEDRLVFNNQRLIHF